MHTLLRIYTEYNLIAVIGIGLVLFVLLVFCGRMCMRRENKKTVRYICMALMIVYLIAVFCATVVFRRSSDFYTLKWPPFWSYMPTKGGGTTVHMLANALNILLFMPLGFLFLFACKYARWWTMLTTAATFSFCIEAGQLMLHCGYCEIDDLLHNCIGALVGYGMAVMVKELSLRIKEKRE